MQTPRRVDEHDVLVVLEGVIHGVVGDSPGVRARLMLDELGPHALGPDLQLLDGRGPEGVPGGQHHRVPLLPQALRDLGDARRLPRAVYAQHQDHRGLSVRPELQRALRGLQDLDQNLFEPPEDDPRVLGLRPLPAGPLPQAV